MVKIWKQVGAQAAVVAEAVEVEKVAEPFIMVFFVYLLLSSMCNSSRMNEQYLKPSNQQTSIVEGDRIVTDSFDEER